MLEYSFLTHSRPKPIFFPSLDVMRQKFREKSYLLTEIWAYCHPFFVTTMVTAQYVAFLACVDVTTGLENIN
jgi:hypothetical protein